MKVNNLFSLLPSFKRKCTKSPMQPSHANTTNGLITLSTHAVFDISDTFETKQFQPSRSFCNSCSLSCTCVAKSALSFCLSSSRI